MVCNTAVFYDIENLIGLFAVRNNTILHLDEIYRRILEVEGVNGVSVQKAYADWAVQINRNLRNYVLQIGIEPVQIFNTNQNDKVKNAADVSLIIDAVELLSKRPDIENYVIVSGDGIFAFLAKKLHEHGKRVIGCGFNRNTNIIFRNACDYFISLEKTDKTLTATSNKSVLTGPSAIATAAAFHQDEPAEAPVATVPEPKPESRPEPKPAQKPAPKPEPKPAPSAAKAVPTPPEVKKTNTPKKVPRRFPKSKFSEALAHADIPIWKNASDTNGALLVIRDVVNVLFGGVADETADLEISVLKTYLDYYVQGFKISQYKFKRFGEFVRFVLTGSPFCIYTAEGTTLKIARRGMVGSKGSVMADMRGLQITLSDGKNLHSLFDVPNHSAFTYEIKDLVKVSPKRDGKKPEAPKPAGSAPQRVPEAVPAPVVESDPEDDISEDGGEDASGEGSVRKWIKANFMRLSLDNALVAGEVKRLQTAEYSQKTFGIKTPVFKEVVTRSNLRDQRLANGKVKYWKEFFKYNGKTYLIYKEWIASLHRDRFSTWLKKVEPKTKKTDKVD